MGKMSRSPDVIVVALIIGFVGLVVEEIVVGAVWSALLPEFTRSLDVITGGFGGLIVVGIEILFFVVLVLALWALVAKARNS
jgi:hypothetical protein